jgi:ribose transport system substrate-binding protein
VLKAMNNFIRSWGRARVMGLGLAAAVAAAVVVAPGASSAKTASAKGKHLSIAYLSFAVQNSYDAPMLAAAKKVAAADNASLTVFDANNSPTTQYSQFQDVIAKRGYQGIITQPIEATNLIPLVNQAVAKHIKVVNIDQVMGPSLSTAKVQVKGLSGNVTFVPTTMGRDLGALTVKACKVGHFNPCNVGYLYDIQASALDVAINRGFSAAIKGSPVRVVATGQDFFTPAQGLTAVQNMLTSNSNINVIAGSDQGIEGAVGATGGKHILLVGYGGSAAGIAGVKTGKWFGTIEQDPATEGKVGMETLINAIRTGSNAPGVNPLNNAPNGGVITKANAKLFTGEWPG